MVFVLECVCTHTCVELPSHCTFAGLNSSFGTFHGQNWLPYVLSCDGMSFGRRQKKKISTPSTKSAISHSMSQVPLDEVPASVLGAFLGERNAHLLVGQFLLQLDNLPYAYGKR